MNFVLPTVQKIKKQSPSVKKEPTVQNIKKQAPSVNNDVTSEEGHKSNSAASRMAALEDENENSKQKVEAVSKAFANYVTKTEFQSQDSVTNSGMVQLKTFMTAVKEEAGKMTPIVLSLQEHLKSKKGENSFLRSEIEVLKDNFTAVKEEEGKMTQIVMSLQEDLISKTDENRFLKSDIEVLKHNYTAGMVQLKTFMNAVKEEGDKMTQTVLSLQEHLKSKTNDNSFLRSEIEVLKDNFTAVKEEEGKMTLIVMSLQEELKSKTEENSFLRSEIKDLNDNLSALEVQVEKNKKKDRISCSYCEKKCNSENSFQRHMIAKHNNLQNLNEN